MMKRKTPPLGKFETLTNGEYYLSAETFMHYRAIILPLLGRSAIINVRGKLPARFRAMLRRNNKLARERNAYQLRLQKYYERELRVKPNTMSYGGRIHGEADDR